MAHFLPKIVRETNRKQCNKRIKTCPNHIKYLCVYFIKQLLFSFKGSERNFCKSIFAKVIAIFKKGTERGWNME